MRLKPDGDLGNRGVPVDFLVAAVGAPAHRRGQPVAVVLVVVQPQRLVAGVALRGGMVLVAADLGELAAVELHDDAAVAFAQDARGGLPVAESQSPGHHLSHRGFPFRHLGLSRARSWPWTVSRASTSREARATTIAPSIEVVVSIASCFGTRARRHHRRPVAAAIRSVQRAKAAAARSITGVAWSGLAGSPASTVTATTGQPAR